jgi:hypothetical protein
MEKLKTLREKIQHQREKILQTIQHRGYDKSAKRAAAKG